MMFGDFLRCVDHNKNVLLSPVLMEIGAKSDLYRLHIRLQFMGHRRRYLPRNNMPAASHFFCLFVLFVLQAWDGRQSVYFFFFW